MKPRRRWPDTAEAAYPLLLEAASRFSGRKLWGRGDQSSYNRALKLGLVNRISEELGWQGPERWPGDPEALRAQLVERARPFARLSRWVEGDPTGYDKAVRDGLTRAIASELGWAVKEDRVWPEGRDDLLAALIRVAAPYTGPVDLKRSDPGVYQKAIDMNLAGPLYAELGWDVRRTGTWPEDPSELKRALLSRAEPFEDLTTFRAADSPAYEAARKRGMLRELCANMDWEVRGPGITWPVCPEALLKAILPGCAGHATFTDWVRAERNAYHAAWKAGLVDRIAEETGWDRKSDRDWPTDPQELLAALTTSARNHHGIRDWDLHDPGATSKARKAGLMKHIARAHGWVTRRYSDRDLVYVWRDREDQRLIKIGIAASSAAGPVWGRIAEVAAKHRLTPEVLALTRLGSEAARVEAELLRAFPTDEEAELAGDGASEFRILSKDRVRDLLDRLDAYGGESLLSDLPETIREPDNEEADLPEPF